MSPPASNARPPSPAGETRSLLRLGLPIIVGLAASALMGVVDSAVLGNATASALAAVSLTSSVALVFIAALYGFLSPVGLLAARGFGQNSPKTVAEHFHTGRRLGWLAGSAGAVLMLGALPLLPLLGQPDEVLAAIAPYWVPTALGLIPFSLTWVYKQVLDAMDRPWLGVGVLAVMVLLNAGFSPVLAHGLLGLPALGLLGAGLGTLLAQCLALGLAMWLSRRGALRAWYQARPDGTREALDTQVREGTPMGAQYLLETGATGVAGLLVGLFGATALAANQIAMSVTMTLYMVPLGLAAAVGIRLSQAIGAGRGGGVLWAICRAGLWLAVAWMGLASLVMAALGDDIMRLFTRHADVISVGAAIFVAVGLMQVADGIQSVSLGALRGLLDNRWPTCVSLVCYWLLAVPLAWALAHASPLGPSGVWVGFGLGLVAAAVALTWRLRRLTRAPSADGLVQ